MTKFKSLLKTNKSGDAYIAICGELVASLNGLRYFFRRFVARIYQNRKATTYGIQERPMIASSWRATPLI